MSQIFPLLLDQPLRTDKFLNKQLMSLWVARAHPVKFKLKFAFLKPTTETSSVLSYFLMGHTTCLNSDTLPYYIRRRVKPKMTAWNCLVLWKLFLRSHLACHFICKQLYIIINPWYTKTSIYTYIQTFSIRCKISTQWHKIWKYCLLGTRYK